MRKRTLSLLGITLSLLGIMLMVGSVLGLAACLGPTGIDPDSEIKLPGKIETVDVTAAVLMLTNRSKTVDVTKVTITQPEETTVPPWAVSFDNKPKRLEKKAQYLAPSDKSYQVVIEYSFDALGGTPAGTGTQTLSIPLPLPKQIVEYIIYRNDKGVVIIDKEALDPDPGDTGNPAIDPLPGEGSSPAVIPPDARNKMATFVVVSKTNSQNIDSVNFIMGDKSYTMHGIHARDRQSIALGQGSWETRLTYTREGVTKTLGPVNSIIVPSNDPQAVQEHYLYFYLNKRDDYAISQTWPPFPNDVVEEDFMPPDNGYGRGLIEIINNSYAMVEMVTIHNLKDIGKFPLSYDYGRFTPPVPVQYNKTGYVDVIGAPAFPIEAHEGYLIQVTLESSDGRLVIIERKAYIKDQIITIVIKQDDLKFQNTQGAKITLENKTNAWPVELNNLIVRNKANSWQSSYYSANTWEPNGSITQDNSADQYVMSTTAMPITEGVEFEALITMYGYGISTTITKGMSPATLYSELTPDQNTRTITITDADVPQSIKDASNYYRGANVTLENKVVSWPVEIIGLTVRNINNTAENSYYETSTWQPAILIGRDQSAVQTVMSSRAMPITPNAEFEALIVINGYGKTETIIKTFSPAQLYSSLTPEQNTRTLTITDSDIPQSIKDAYIYSRGAHFTVYNDTDVSPVQIIGVTIKNKSSPTQNSFYGEREWTPHVLIDSKKSATFMVNSSPDMPINPGAEFDAIVFLFANNKTDTLIKAFSPAALYSDKDPALNTRIIRVADSEVPADLKPPIPPTPTAQGAKITLENRITSWPVNIIGMTVQNKARKSECTSYGGSSWTLPGQITRNNSAVQMVYESTTMPIGASDRFEAQITLQYSGTTATVTKDFSPAELYTTINPDLNLRTITVTDTDVPQSIIDAYIYARGAKVIIENRVKTNWPVQITDMTVRNRAVHSQNTSYGSATWVPRSVIRNGQNAEQTVMSSAAMPIRTGVQFEAVITLLGNGHTDTVTKVFSPAELYSDDDPSANPRTITINDTDIILALQTPDPEPPPEEKPDIGGANIGDTIVIDGIEWIKIRTTINAINYTGDLVLLMLKGVTGPAVKYNDDGKATEYYTNYTDIKKYVDTWYASLNSPTLKKIAWTVQIGTSPNESWPGTTIAGATNYNTIAFLPRLKDLEYLTKAQTANNYRYWLTDIYTNPSYNNGKTMKTVTGDGTTAGADAPADYLGVYARPCIWVTSKF